MSATRLSKYRFSCEHCPTVVVVEQETDYPLPEGWGTLPHYDCGLTGYTDHRDACPDCMKKYAGKKVW